MEARGQESIDSPRVAYVHRRVARAIELLATAGTGVFLALFGLGAIDIEFPPSLYAGMAFWAMVPIALPFLVALVLRSVPAFGPAKLERVGERLALESSGLFGRRRRLLDVRGGHILPEGRTSRAELHLATGDRVLVDTPDDASAEAVLRLAGVDASHQRARFRLADPVGVVFAAMLLLSLALIPAGLALTALSTVLPLAAASVLGLAAAVGFTWFGLAATGMPEIAVGTDGLSYRRLRRDRFIPLGDITDVRASGMSLLIHLRDGSVRRIRSVTTVAADRAWALARRVREAQGVHGELLPAQLEVLDRRGRAVSDWLRALADVARAGTSYRSVGLTAEDLEAIVQSPDVTPERRIAAALALRAASPDTAPERLRIAAAQCASPGVRVVLEQASEGEVEESAVAEALVETARR
jgi:membrane protein implicated in regulation of membrane protease activity